MALKRNKRLLALFAAFFLAVVLYGGLWFYLMLGPRQAHFFLAASTSLADERLGDLRLGQRIDSIAPPPVPEPNNNTLALLSVC
ncbi:hypothetical protein [Paenibacillus mucilaginosus]|uniref:Uncharacterized protein n=1 Tax=Paenibacillus mucilaginosus (strain KNP414) TaxID=1036673 RepID=F8F8Q8_PAEMK|nr:hypothetical protein [Paenibacillus mucilaginosus]AEI41970.1 hypothetical protein KNP414_03412 [Paenibacillus mucilaginosus KNP414]MCG7217844.1 hypothetical protein [Paenibacillus mucilaginosus]WDM28876.1 hypothetical protein KCX80_06635 [Paenibacillus mucilaginosus]